MAKRSKKQDDMLPPIPSKKKNVQDLTLKNKGVIDERLKKIESRLDCLESCINKNKLAGCSE